MRNTSGFVGMAALIGDQVRAAMLVALVDGKALTASELASRVAITKQSARSHLAKLVDGDVLRVIAQGPHRYFQLASADVAAVLESSLGVAQYRRTAARSPGPRDPALRRARRCYGHLAGELAVEAFDAFLTRGLLSLTQATDTVDTLALTPAGLRFFSRLDIDPAALGHTRRPVCRPCLDWSMRRYHLAGSLGTALLEFCYRNGWAKPAPGSRVVQFSAEGEAQFRKMLSRTARDAGD